MLASLHKAAEHSKRAKRVVIVPIGVLRDVLPHVLRGHANIRALDALLEVTPKAFDAVHMVNAGHVLLGAMIARAAWKFSCLHC